jgi:hypothetical protein
MFHEGHSLWFIGINPEILRSIPPPGVRRGNFSKKPDRHNNRIWEKLHD